MRLIAYGSPPFSDYPITDYLKAKASTNMRNLLLGLCLLLPTLSFAQDASEYRVIPSITDWIEEINNWPDTIYKVENIKVIIDIKKDSLIAENYLIRQGSLEEVAATINKPLDITRLIIDNDFGNSANNGITL